MRGTNRWELAAPSAPETPGKRPPLAGSAAGNLQDLDRSERARGYLSEGRLRIEFADADRVEATLSGHRGTYRLGRDALRGWWCSCGRGPRCAHLLALVLVIGEERDVSARRANWSDGQTAD
jgi:hypothetical protein